jgi:hypothetical protein
MRRFLNQYSSASSVVRVLRDGRLATGAANTYPWIMTKRTNMTKRTKKPAKRKQAAVDTPEKRSYLESLRHHGRVKKGDCKDNELPPGVTHVLVERGDRPPLLIEKRKSFF